MSGPDAPPASSAMTRQGWPLSWPVIGVLLLLFVVLAILAGTIGTLPGDLWTTRHLQRLHGQPWRALWHLGDAFGTSGWVVWIALATVIGAAARRWWQDVAFLLGVLVLRLAAVPIKGVVQSARPAADQAHIVEISSGYGFPSGHTLTATVLFGTIAFLLVHHVPSAWMPRLAIAVWIAGVSITGFARIWSGAHWASDVLGASLLGVVSIAIAAKLSARSLGLGALLSGTGIGNPMKNQQGAGQ